MMKRLMDITLSIVGILVLSPLFIPLMIILRFSGEGEIFYVQERIGLNGKKFGLFKFATMLKNSPSIGSGTITLSEDPRVLPLGGFLRKTKINELPQIFNALLGQISFVGPRPQTQECFDFFPKDAQEGLQSMKPGITGIGSIIFRDEESIIGASDKDYASCYREDIMPYKAELELWYKQNRSIWVDCWMIFFTGWVILFPKSTAYTIFFKGLPEKGI